MASRPPEHDPGYENRLRSNEYSVSVECRNCGHRYRVAIVKGQIVEDALEEAYCEYCDCQNTLEKM